MLSVQLTPFPEVRTKQLLLRELNEQDAPALPVQRSDARIMRYLDREPDTTLAQTLALIDLLKQSAADNLGVGDLEHCAAWQGRRAAGYHWLLADNC